MKLSVIISNRNDVSLLSVTVRSCIEELKPLGPGASEVVVCDNSDQSVFEDVKSVIPTRYITEGKVQLLRQPFPCLFTARELAINSAKGKYVACVDSHMLIGHNMFRDLYEFMERKTKDGPIGFAHAPLGWSNRHERFSVHDRDMSVCELGNWGSAYKFERKMTWKGMPWICDRRWFIDTLKGYWSLSRHRMSWGGGDMHIGVKPWLLGFPNWAVPTSPAVHIGPFVLKDKGVRARDKYRVYATSGVGPACLGFLVSCYVLGGEEMMRRNKAGLKKKFPFLDSDRYWSEAKRLGETERRWLDEVKVMSFAEFLRSRPWDDDRYMNYRGGTVVGAR